MAIILDLPNELLTRFADYVHPADIVNTALSHSIIAAAATRALQPYHERAREYQHLVLKGSRLYQDNLLPFTTLFDIFTVDGLSYYPRSVKMECCNIKPDPNRSLNGATNNEEEDVDSTCKLVESLEPMILAKLEETAYFDERETSLIIDALRVAEWWAILGMLLLLLLNLEVIILENDYWQTNTLDTIVNAIAKCRGEKSRPRDSGFRALTKLSELHVRINPDIRQSGRPEGVRLDMLESFSELPSMRSISAAGMSRGSIHHRPYTLRGQSNLETLRLMGICQTQISLKRTLSGNKALKNLHITLDSINEIDSLLWGLGSDKYQIKSTLRSFSVLRYYDYQHSRPPRTIASMGYLHFFEALTQVSLPVGLYLTHDIPPRKVVKLTKALPSSLEYIDLYGKVDVNTIENMLEDLAENKALRHPNLREIIFQDVEHSKSDEGPLALVSIRDVLASVNVSLVIYFCEG